MKRFLAGRDFLIINKQWHGFDYNLSTNFMIITLCFVRKFLKTNILFVCPKDTLNPKYSTTKKQCKLTKKNCIAVQLEWPMVSL